MDLRQLRYFQAVAEELSFSRAARRLHVAQPALSRVVKELEDEFGAELLVRNRRHVRLTPVGAVLLREAGVLLERHEAACRRVRRAAAGDEGELRLGYIGPPTQPFLARMVEAYRGKFPRVTVHLEERTPERVWEMVAQRRLTLGLTRPVLARQALGLETFLLRRERLGVALRRDHPFARRKTVAWTDLASEPLVILARREGVSSHDEILAACRAAKVTPRLAHTPSLIGTVLHYVAAGEGVGVVPESVVTEPAAPGLVFRPLLPAHAVELVMVWSADDDSPAAAAFRALVTDWHRTGRLWKDDGRAQ